MLQLLGTTGFNSDRRLRLFAVACIRNAGVKGAPKCADLPELAAVERFADGAATAEELREAFDYRDVILDEGYARLAQARPISVRTIADIVHDAVGATAYRTYTSHTAAAATASARVVQCELFRDIFGPLPFREIRIDPSCLTPAVIKLAQTSYEQRSFDRMPELGRAIQDAGCQDPEVLDHCLERGRIHVRGCWCLDLILGKT